MRSVDTLVRTALPSSVRVEKGAGGLPRLGVKSRHGSAQICFQGAHVTGWHPVSATAPVLWTSRDSLFETGRPIRGGVPICFPWFAAHATDAAAPLHGFARVRPWTVIDAREDGEGIVTLALALVSGDERPSLWPHAFRLVYRITVGPTLTLALETHNPGRAPFRYESALHTYYAVQDVREVTVTGLEGVEYLDKVAAPRRERQGREPIRFTGETDRVYLSTPAACVIHDPGKRRRITIRKTGADATVVWNPWIDKARAMPDFGDTEWPEMVCVETGNVNLHARTLAPGATETMTTRIEVEAL